MKRCMWGRLNPYVNLLLKLFLRTIRRWGWKRSSFNCPRRLFSGPFVVNVSICLNIEIHQQELSGRLNLLWKPGALKGLCKDNLYFLVPLRDLEKWPVLGPGHMAPPRSYSAETLGY